MKTFRSLLLSAFFFFPLAAGAVIHDDPVVDLFSHYCQLDNGSQLVCSQYYKEAVTAQYGIEALVDKYNSRYGSQKTQIVLEQMALKLDWMQQAYSYDDNKLFLIQALSYFAERYALSLSNTAYQNNYDYGYDDGYRYRGADQYERYPEKSRYSYGHDDRFVNGYTSYHQNTYRRKSNPIDVTYRGPSKPVLSHYEEQCLKHGECPYRYDDKYDRYSEDYAHPVVISDFDIEFYGRNIGDNGRVPVGHRVDMAVKFQNRSNERKSFKHFLHLDRAHHKGGANALFVSSNCGPEGSYRLRSGEECEAVYKTTFFSEDSYHIDNTVVVDGMDARQPTSDKGYDTSVIAVKVD